MIDTIIVSGGNIHSDFALDFLKKNEACLIAADKGLEFFLEHQLLPDAVIGDFDSLSEDGKKFLEIQEEKSMDSEIPYGGMNEWKVQKGFGNEIKEIKGDNKVSSIKLVQNKTGEEKELEVSGVFVAVGMKPVTDIFKDYVELDKTGYIKAGEDCKTSSEGIFAAGDIRTKPLRQVVTAVADGATAVQSVERYLNGR